MTQPNELAPQVEGTCGAMLAAARSSAAMSCDEVAAQLKIPARVVRALEADDWTRLGAPVFVRGQLRSYARLLGIDIEPQLSRSDVAAVVPAELVSHSHTPRYQRVLEQATRRGIYIVLTVAIALPVWLGMRPHLSNELAVASLDFPASAPVSAGSSPASPPQRTPLTASMTSITSPAVPALSLQFTGDSWLQVFAMDGRELERGNLGAGERRSYGSGEVGRVVVGNSAAVELKKAGKPVDLAPFTRANVARFTLSSDGSLAPVAP